MDFGCMKTSLRQVIGGIIFTLLVVCFGFMQDLFYPLEISNWFFKIILAGFHGAAAPYMWIGSLFSDNPHLIAKMSDQGALYGAFWWVAFIGAMFALVAVVCSLIGKLFKK